MNASSHRTSSALTAVPLLLAFALAACGSAEACPLIAPRALPDGSEAGEATVTRTETGAGLATWGSTEGPRVTERILPVSAPGRPSCAPAEVPLELGCFPASDQTQFRGKPAVFTAAGPEPTAAVTMAFVEGTCLYEITVGPGLTVDEVKAYAADF